MKRRQFEEILDECISAYLSGRRDVEHSLSLYPSIARELEPLLRAAADTADTFREINPSARVQERIRVKIQRAAAERAAARALTRNIDGFSSRREGHGHWWLAMPLLSAAAAAIVVASLLFFREDALHSPGNASVSVVERPQFAAHLSDARRHLTALQSKAAGGKEVTPEDIDALLGTTLRLAGEAQPGLDAGDQAEVERILEEQIALLGQLTGASGEESDQIVAAVETTVSVAAAFGVALHPVEPDASPAGGATASSPTTHPAGSSPGAPSPPAPSSTPSPAPNTPSPPRN